MFSVLLLVCAVEAWKGRRSIREQRHVAGQTRPALFVDRNCRRAHTQKKSGRETKLKQAPKGHV